MLMVDAQVARGGRAGLSFHEPGGRGGRINGAKRTLLLDITGSPVAVSVSSARPHDVRVAREPLETVLDALPSVKAIVADRGYRGLAALLPAARDRARHQTPPNGASPSRRFGPSGASRTPSHDSAAGGGCRAPTRARLPAHGPGGKPPPATNCWGAFWRRAAVRGTTPCCPATCQYLQAMAAKLPDGWRTMSVRYTLEPTVDQTELIARHMGASRFAWNQVLRLVKDALDVRAQDGTTEAPWTPFSLINAFNAWKRSPEAGSPDGLPWRSEVFQGVMEEACVDLGRALGAVSGSRNRTRKGARMGFPRFKKRGRGTESCRFRAKGPGSVHIGTEDAARVVKLPRIGAIRVREDTRRVRRLIRRGARPLQATVRRDGRRLVVAITLLVRRSTRRTTTARPDPPSASTAASPPSWSPPPPKALRSFASTTRAT